MICDYWRGRGRGEGGWRIAQSLRKYLCTMFLLTSAKVSLWHTVKIFDIAKILTFEF